MGLPCKDLIGLAGWSLSQTSGKPQEELLGSGLCGPLCCSLGKPGRKKLLASFGQERWWLGVGRGGTWQSSEGVWWPLLSMRNKTQTG